MEKTIIEEVQELYQQGENIGYINKTLKIRDANKIIEQLMKEKKIDIIARNKARMKKRSADKIASLSDEQIMQIKEGYESRKRYEEITEQTGIEYDKLKEIIDMLEASGIIDKSNRDMQLEKEKQEKRIKFKKAYEEGKGKSEIIKSAHINFLDYEDILEDMKKNHEIDKEKRLEALREGKEKELNLIKRLYEEGFPNNAISAQLQLAPAKVKYYLEEMQKNEMIDERKRLEAFSKRRKEKKESIKRLYEAGVLEKEIRIQLELTYAEFKAYLEEMQANNELNEGKRQEVKLEKRVKSSYEKRN